jgi:hypothetical protein
MPLAFVRVLCRRHGERCSKRLNTSKRRNARSQIFWNSRTADGERSHR